MLGAKANCNKAYKCVAYAKRKERLVSKAPLNIDVLIELYGTITLCHSVTLDPLECKTNIRYLNGTNNKTINNLH